MPLNIGRQSRVWVRSMGGVIGDKYESEPAAMAAAKAGVVAEKFAFSETDAVRHINVGMTYDLFQRITSPEKKLAPGPFERFNRRRNVMLDTLEGLLRPSGFASDGTALVPEPHQILLAAFGRADVKSDVGIALGSTDPTASGFHASASDHGIVVGDWLRINTSHGAFLRRVTAVATDEVSFDAVPAAPGNETDTIPATYTESYGTVDQNANSGANSFRADLTVTIPAGTVLVFSGGATATVSNEVTAGDDKTVSLSANLSANVAIGETFVSEVTASRDISRHISKAAAVYRLTTNVTTSLAVLHALDEWQRVVTGVGINSFALNFDSNEEPRFTASGPARDYYFRERARGTGVIKGPNSENDAFVPGYAHPTSPLGSFTPPNIDLNPPSGLDGRLFVGDQGSVGSSEILFKKMDFTIENAYMLRNTEYGKSIASELYRSGRRAVSGSLEAYLDGSQPEWFRRSIVDINGPNASLVRSNASVLIQTGSVKGNMIGVYMPRMEVTNPQQDDPEEAVSWTFNIMALENTRDGNDEMELVFA